MCTVVWDTVVTVCVLWCGTQCVYCGVGSEHSGNSVCTVSVVPWLICKARIYIVRFSRKHFGSFGLRNQQDSNCDRFPDLTYPEANTLQLTSSSIPRTPAVQQGLGYSVPWSTNPWTRDINARGSKRQQLTEVERWLTGINNSLRWRDG